MNKVFDVKFEFDRLKVNNIVEGIVEHKGKGYICVVDGNVIANAHKDPEYRNILNKSSANTCDGFSIALFARFKFKKRFDVYTGSEFFSFHLDNSKYKHYFLGNTNEVLSKIEDKLISKGFENENMIFESLPFQSVELFDYKEIAFKINNFKPDIIWVSLGAPKQELFIDKLFPFINSGVLVAIGAAFNFYIDEEAKRAPLWLRKIHFEWLYRMIKEPKRVGKRGFEYISLLPKLLREEFKNK